MRDAEHSQSDDRLHHPRVVVYGPEPGIVLQIAFASVENILFKTLVDREVGSGGIGSNGE
jgi:hypothetical protein